MDRFQVRHIIQYENLLHEIILEKGVLRVPLFQSHYHSTNYLTILILVLLIADGQRKCGKLLKDNSLSDIGGSWTEQ